MKKMIIGLVLVLVILFSGCVTMSYDAKVNSSGGIEEYNMTMDTNSYVYSALNSQMLEEDGESLRDGVISNGGEYKEVWDGDKVEVQVSGLTSENASVEKDKDYIVYRDQIGTLGDYDENEEDEEDLFGMNEAMDSAIQIHYYLEMPNEIIDSNADYIEGNKAEWHMLNSTSIRDVYAKCETPSLLPGMGLLNCVIIFLIMAFIVKKKF
ncbi:hypothetical protein EQO05_13925 [Methanosarcina sp. MSH10X1]|uniref:hypothetical protein n=1 Tax=Methanosarcina sp. MSH10X1 TaxID=2507075 RepID=UPI000FFB20C2|nr:hypothetical protein [Methanosarcina sp. MSH10X1]RXA16470.1 hypothetical protein EQO05_13925 [Methanosarcina sp. MSH10X1]